MNWYNLNPKGFIEVHVPEVPGVDPGGILVEGGHIGINHNCQ